MLTAVDQPVEQQIQMQSLPVLIDRAAKALAGARTSAEILEAKEIASFAYDAAKKTARLAKAKDAHDDIIQRVYRAQADALEIEAGAKRRLADEYDAAQDRGEVQGRGGQGKRDIPNENIPSVSDLGLTSKDIHEARTLRDAEKADPGVTKRILNDRIKSGGEPSKAALRQGIIAASIQGLRGGNGTSVSRKNPMYQPSAQAEAVRVIVGSCQRLLDGAGEYAPEYIIGGFRSEGERARSLAVITECRDFLNDILEAANAE
jgi:hypothetical protein